MIRIPKIRITFWRILLAAVMVVGLYATFIRFSRGLGAATGMNDQSPWGIWIGFDLLCGVGLAAGGFTLAAIVYIFHLEKYRPILRAAVLTAFLGYLLAIMSLMFDLGKPYNIWHPIVMWNHHSVMFEVAWCVMLYTTVLALELSPAVFERFGLKRPLRLVHALTIPIVIVGVLLSTLHQSSLGTLFVIVPEKMHGLWYTPILPVLFYLSAIAVGLSMVTFESSLSNRAYGVQLHPAIMRGLARASVYMLGIYLGVRFLDLLIRRRLGLIFEGSLESWMFIAEIAIGFILPLILYAMPSVRESTRRLFYTSLLVVMGFVMNRLDVSMTAMQRYANYSYTPSFLEVATTLFVTGIGFILFALAVRYFPVFPRDEESGYGDGHDLYEPLAARRRKPLTTRMPRIASASGTTFLAFLVVVFAAAAYWVSAQEKPRYVTTDWSGKELYKRRIRKLDRPLTEGLRLPEPYTFALGVASPGPVTFTHQTHVRGNREACTNCHLRLYDMAPIADRSSPRDDIEDMRACATCHNGTEAFDIQKDCYVCHVRQQTVPLKAVAEEGRVLSDYTYPMGKGSPGPVAFSHALHVEQGHNSCSICHPTSFKMVRPDRAREWTVDMKSVHSGGQCGACHNGVKAFSVDSDCKLCHGGTRGAHLAKTLAPDRLADVALPKRHGSPGPVVFSHQMHTNNLGIACSACHPNTFRMVAPGEQSAAFTMRAMDKGTSCGKCHNGISGFSVKGDCNLCHRGATTKAIPAGPDRRQPPKDYKFTQGDGSPGKVIFSHETHAKGREVACGKCHPQPFAMVQPSAGQKYAITWEKMVEGANCGVCHNGKDAFSASENCELCHTE